jgi:hypothetical protein
MIRAINWSRRILLAAADWITAVEADDQPDLHSFVRRAWRPVRLRLLR